ncbi:MAG: META domain-containing protein, partial [Anaerolineales bacterium]|nr:META domain-containing protein [Anaerolineales bacterium]
FQDCPTAVGITTYRLEARNLVGELVSQDRTVSVADNTTPDNPLANTEWAVIAINESPTLTDSLTTLVFDPNGNVSGSAGCNNYSGTYSLSGVNLRFSAVSTSNLFCSEPEGIMEQEQLFIRVLIDVVRFEQPEGASLLVMYDIDGRELVRAVAK